MTTRHYISFILKVWFTGFGKHSAEPYELWFIFIPRVKWTERFEPVYSTIINLLGCLPANFPESKELDVSFLLPLLMGYDRTVWLCVLFVSHFSLQPTLSLYTPVPDRAGNNLKDLRLSLVDTMAFKPKHHINSVREWGMYHSLRVIEE